MKVKIKKLDELATIPQYMSAGAVGMDLVAVSKIVENDRIVYGTGLAFEIPEGYFMMIAPRSSIYKKDLYLCNSIGYIDADFRGEVKFIFRKDLTNVGPNNFLWSEVNTEYQVGERIGQAVILPYPKIEFEEVDELSSTERDTGGFGSSGN